MEGSSNLHASIIQDNSVKQTAYICGKTTSATPAVLGIQRTMRSNALRLMPRFITIYVLFQLPMLFYFSCVKIHRLNVMKRTSSACVKAGGVASDLEKDNNPHIVDLVHLKIFILTYFNLHILKEQKEQTAYLANTQILTVRL